ncbi:hypothetical protein SAMN05880593_11383 [Rhizobium sp. RU36D]|nr:hypothetical protein SAMN05880593_11383 [Rhizobium sp. RU36D]
MEMLPVAIVPSWCCQPMWAFSPTPLWSADHLPLKGGDRIAAPARPLIKRRKARDGVRQCRESISPLEGEMPGRAEGGTLDIRLKNKQQRTLNGLSREVAKAAGRNLPNSLAGRHP